MKKKIITITLLACLSLSLIACGNKKEDKASAETTQETIQTETNKETENTNSEPESTENTKLNALLENFGKPLNEMSILDNNKWPTMREDEDTYWLFSQQETSARLKSNSLSNDAYFVNPTNNWISSDELPVTYYNLTEDYFTDMMFEKKYKDNLMQEDIIALMGEPYQKFSVEEDTEEIFIYELENDYYTIIWFHTYSHYASHYIVEKENCGYIIGEELANQLGYPLENETSNVIATNKINELIADDTLTLRLCGKIMTFTNLEGYDIKTEGYSIDNKGIINVPSINFNKSSSESEAEPFLMNYSTFASLIGPFYKETLSNEKKVTMVKDTEDYAIYKADPEQFTDTTSEWCVLLKNADIVVTATYLNYEDPEDECIASCEAIANYFLNYVTITNAE